MYRLYKLSYRKVRNFVRFSLILPKLQNVWIYIVKRVSTTQQGVWKIISPSSVSFSLFISFVTFDSGFEILFLASPYTLSFLPVLRESGIIMVQSCRFSSVRPRSTRKVLPAFSVSLLYIRRWIYEFNNGAVKLLLCLQHVYFMGC